MIKNKFLLLLFLCMFFSCKAQDIRIVVEDSVIVTDKEISVFQIENGKDTLYLKTERPEYYRLDKRNDDIKLIVKYKTSLFELSDIRDITKCIYINYKPDAEKDCFVIQELYSDAIQTKTVSSLKDCSDITNIYFYREFEPKITKMDLKIRKEN